MMKAPWTKEQVDNLNEYQNCGYVHPFTWDTSEGQVELIATENGWVAEEGGPVVQDWCLPWMANGSFRMLNPFHKRNP